MKERVFHSISLLGFGFEQERHLPVVEYWCERLRSFTSLLLEILVWIERKRVFFRLLDLSRKFCDFWYGLKEKGFSFDFWTFLQNFVISYWEVFPYLVILSGCGFLRFGTSFVFWVLLDF